MFAKLSNKLEPQQEWQVKLLTRLNGMETKVKADPRLQALLVLFAVLFLSLGVWRGVDAAISSGTVRKEVKIEFGKTYDTWLSDAGVYIANSNYDATLVIYRQDHDENHGSNCDLSSFTDVSQVNAETCPPGSQILWYSNLLVVNMYEGEEGVEPLDEYRGQGKIYFNLDLIDRRAYDEYDDGRFNIWYYYEWVDEWVECPGTLIRDSSAPRGRLTCEFEEMGSYGIGLKEEPFINKLIKAGLVTITPVP